MGGSGGGTNPEQLFAVGYAACFESALALVLRRRRMEPGATVIDSKVVLLTDDERGFAISVSLDVTLDFIDEPKLAVEVVRAAHEVCPYARATRGNIDVVLTANGLAVFAQVPST
jgi:osmotically inducible protein OsmC